MATTQEDKQMRKQRMKQLRRQLRRRTFQDSFNIRQIGEHAKNVLNVTKGIGQGVVKAPVEAALNFAEIGNMAAGGDPRFSYDTKLLGKVQSAPARMQELQQQPGYTPFTAGLRAASEGTLGVASLGAMAQGVTGEQGTQIRLPKSQAAQAQVGKGTDMDEYLARAKGQLKQPPTESGRDIAGSVRDSLEFKGMPKDVPLKSDQMRQAWAKAFDLKPEQVTDDILQQTYASRVSDIADKLSRNSANTAEAFRMTVNPDMTLQQMIDHALNILNKFSL